MKLNAFETELVNAGHATTEEPSFSEPQTLSGNYRATNGFWYYCGWDNGVPTVAKIGYSDQYLQAVEATEHNGILNLPESGEDWERGVRARLDLVDHRSNLKRRGLTVTKAGTTISTVEQNGEWSGQRVGRLWVKFANEGARWHYHGLSDTAKAFAVALKLARSTEDQIREYFA